MGNAWVHLASKEKALSGSIQDTLLQKGPFLQHLQKYLQAAPGDVCPPASLALFFYNLSEPLEERSHPAAFRNIGSRER